MFCFDERSRNTVLAYMRAVCPTTTNDCDIFPALSFQQSMLVLRHVAVALKKTPTVRREFLLQALRHSTDNVDSDETIDFTRRQFSTVAFVWLCDRTLQAFATSKTITTRDGPLVREFAVCIVQMERNELATTSYIVEVDYFDAADHARATQESDNGVVPFPIGLFVQKTKAMLSRNLRGPVWLKEPKDNWIRLWSQFGLIENDEEQQFTLVSRVPRTVENSSSPDNKSNNVFFYALRRFLAENLLYSENSVSAVLGPDGIICANEFEQTLTSSVGVAHTGPSAEISA